MENNEEYIHIDIVDEIIKGIKEERIELRKKDGYTIDCLISRFLHIF